MIANEAYTARKNKQKRLRTLVQIVLLVVLLGAGLSSLLLAKTYRPNTPSHDAAGAGDKGFIALAYFGVERTGDRSLIAAARLREHLQALKNQGYVTITQQDVLDYYQTGKRLPEKSLFLIFEDGRRDTAIFAQHILEDLNYKATMLTYPEKFQHQDTKFLRPGELKALEKTTFWEMGSNGYRLAFINVVDRYGNYLGELSPLEHARIAPYLGRKYNHYLMDYIRDEYGVPKESHANMKTRISDDYELLQRAYVEGLGYVPGMYILMHSNTGSFGNNDKVSAVNEYWINKLFAMNFNREGFSLNQRNSSLFDLTRMQPQPYWHTNHLLMRIKHDINQEVAFVAGDLVRQGAWETLKGAAQLVDETLVLTSLPKDSGLLRLKDSAHFGDLKLSVRLKGNKLGLQKIYLRTDEARQQFVAVYLFNNALYVAEKTTGPEKILFRLNLDRHDGKPQLSIPEDKKAAEVRELETFLQYAGSPKQAQVYAEQLKDKLLEMPLGLADGAPEYVPELSVHAPGDRQLAISLKGQWLSVSVDGTPAVAELAVAALKPGSVCLESAWGGYGWSQRNLADDVYDGVFEQLVITDNTGAEKEKILFDGRLQGVAAAVYRAKQQWESIVTWFITNL